jgi:hypothetical protein
MTETPHPTFNADGRRFERRSWCAEPQGRDNFCFNSAALTCYP